MLPCMVDTMLPSAAWEILRAPQNPSAASSFIDNAFKTSFHAGYASLFLPRRALLTRSTVNHFLTHVSSNSSYSRIDSLD
jgi:hypothetical protein